MRYLHLLVILLTVVTLITPQITGRKLQILAILLTVVTLITAEIIGRKLQNLDGITAASLERELSRIDEYQKPYAPDHWKKKSKKAA